MIKKYPRISKLLKLINPYVVVTIGALMFWAFIGGFVLGTANTKTTANKTYTSSASDSPYPSVDVTQIESDVNQQRVAAGLSPFTVNALLTQSACAKAEDMVARNYWSHNTPDGKTPWSFVDVAGYRYYSLGENLAYGFRTGDDVVTGWMNSPGHKANVLGNYAEMGTCVKYGLYQGIKTALIVEHYGRPL